MKIDISAINLAICMCNLCAIYILCKNTVNKKVHGVNEIFILWTGRRFSKIPSKTLDCSVA